MISSIQSMPAVAATPTAAAMAVPTSAATTPTSRVSQSGMFCLPGATTRPKMPMTKPITSAVMIPVTSIEILHQVDCITMMPPHQNPYTQFGATAHATQAGAVGTRAPVPGPNGGSKTLLVAVGAHRRIDRVPRQRGGGGLPGSGAGSDP